MSASSASGIAPIARSGVPKARRQIAVIVVTVVAFAALPLALKSYGTYLCSLFCVS